MISKELKIKWVEALRSGEYEQGYGTLHRNGRYCCLGVLAEVCGVEKDAATDNVTAYLENGLFNTGEFGMSVGLTKYQLKTLVFLNDERAKDLSAIANYIEKRIGPKIV